MAADTRRRRSAPIGVALLLLLGAPAAATAATISVDVYVRDYTAGTPGNPAGVYPGLLTAGTPDNPNTLLDQEIRVERSINGIDARIAVSGGRLSALASGTWGSSTNQGAEPSYEAVAAVSVRDSFTLSGPGAPVSLDFQVALDGGLQAVTANAYWQMDAYLTQPGVGSVFLVGEWDSASETGYPPYGLWDYQEGISGDLSGSTYLSSSSYLNPPVFFERDVPIEVFWVLYTTISDRNTPLGSPGGASADFFRTATWLGITARDADGNIVEGLEYVGASDYDWMAGEPAPVPLPPTGWLVLTGLAAVAAARKR